VPRPAAEPHTSDSLRQAARQGLNPMQWLNQFAPAVQAVSAVCIFLLTVALFFLTRQYVGATEALQKPSITLKSEPRDPMDAIMLRPKVAQVARGPGVNLVNVGTGPALDLSFRFLQTSAEERQPRMDISGFVNYLSAGHEWEAALSCDSLRTRIFEFYAEYESLSGKKYDTKIRIESGIITKT
jgi:hypothetical protein